MTKEYSPEEHKRWFDALHKRVSSAAIILETDSGKALIVKANYKVYWTFPGGVVDEGETPRQTALRETQEEVGITVSPEELTFAWVADRLSDELQTYQFIFKARMSEDEIDRIALDQTEIDEYAFVDKTQVLSGDRHYAQAIRHWANGAPGYVEQTFGKGD